jgi:hypothetical protein
VLTNSGKLEGEVLNGESRITEWNELQGLSEGVGDEQV